MIPDRDPGNKKLHIIRKNSWKSSAAEANTIYKNGVDIPGNRSIMNSTKMSMGKILFPDPSDGGFLFSYPKGKPSCPHTLVLYAYIIPWDETCNNGQYPQQKGVFEHVGRR